MNFADNKLQILIYTHSIFIKFDLWCLLSSTSYFPVWRRVQLSEKKVVKITNHIYQPKHEILPRKEAEEILKKYNTKPSQLPYIMISDKAIEDLDVRPGDIIKITRKSPTAGESVYYRYVVEG
jgi:DNA-directed RNA polymerase subunit H